MGRVTAAPIVAAVADLEAREDQGASSGLHRQTVSTDDAPAD
jgi:hypothetical protein